MPLAKKTSFVLGNFFVYITAIIFISSFFISPTSIYASTTVVADITENTTWTQGQSPYIVIVPITIAEGVTLTIEPGVIIKFDDSSSLFVDGILNASGTTAEPIYLTSYADDSLGGDTNGDGNNTTPIAGDWDGILFFNTIDSSSIFNTNMTYASRGLLSFGAHSMLNNFSIVGTTGDAIALYEGSDLIGDAVSIKNVSDGDALVIWDASIATIKNLNIDGVSDSSAIDLYNNSTLSISDSSIKNLQDEDSTAIGIFGASLNVINTIFENGAGDGISVYNGGALTLERSIISQFANTGISDYSDDSSGVDKIDIKNSKIENNGIGLSFYGSNTAYSISGNTISNNINFGVESYAPITISLKNNYWGDKSGPKHDPDNLSGLGNEVFDIPDYNQVVFIPFCKDESCKMRNPVIIIPGVLGTEINRPTESGSEKLWLDLAHNLTDIGDEFMDALQFNTDLTPSDTSLTIGDVIGKATIDLGFGEVTFYNYTFGLIEEFKSQGYIEGTDLFLFPYDWRYGVSEDNVNKLKQKIADILTQTGIEKIDVIAHSMGGLLVKKYVVENPEGNNIEKAIFVGVPNTGAPKAIKALIQGDGNLLTADSEMKKISQNIPAAYDLLPSEQYYNNKGSYVEIIDHNLFSSSSRDLSFEDMNTFLTEEYQLNAQAIIDAHKLHTADFDNYDLRTAGVDLYAIDGCKTGTIGKVVEVHNHGFLNDYTSYNAPEEVPGDGTVPLESATNLPIDEANKFFALKGEHGEMLSSEGIRQKIVNIISGSTLSTQDGGSHEIITQDILECKLNGRAISVYSPLSISIVDQNGNHSGLASDGVSIENNIPNADFQIMGEHKFVYLPTDEEQTYTISIAGTGTGTFTITDATIEENNVIQTQVFSNISVTPNLLGSISLSNNTNTTLSLDTDGDGATDQTLESTSILNASESQDFVPEPLANNPPEDDEEDISPTQDNSQNNTPVVSSGRGGSFLLVVSQNNKPIQSVDNTLVSLPTILTEIPVETFTEKQENNSISNTKNTQNIEPIFTLTPVEDFSEENNLTANVVDSKASANKTIVLVIFISTIILLLAKKFIK